MAISESNITAGTLIGTWTSGTISSTFSPTSSVGTVSGVTFDLVISQSLTQFRIITTTSGWDVKTIVRPL